MQVDNIRKFLATNYSDEKLAALLTHAESGRLGWNSCCCLVGIATATHTLQTATSFGEMRESCPGDWHLEGARRLPYAAEAENEFLHIAWSDVGRRERLLPLIREEMERRERSEITPSASTSGQAKRIARNSTQTQQKRLVRGPRYREEEPAVVLV